MESKVEKVLRIGRKARRLVASKKFEHWLIFVLLVGILFFASPVHALQTFDDWKKSTEGQASIDGCQLGGGNWVPPKDPSSTTDRGYCDLDTDYKYDPTLGYKEIMVIDEGLYGTSHSSQSLVTNTIMGLANSGMAIIGGTDTFVGSENIDQSKLGAMTRKGLLGVTDQGIYSAASFGEEIKTTQHLAENWVPGYKSNTTSAAVTPLNPPYGYDYLVQMGLASVWQRTLVMSYIFFVVIFIVVGFMIMFRSKIGGQVAVTVYNTLPQIIFSLVLATFSFAIVGLILNLSAWLSKFVLAFMNLKSTGPGSAYTPTGPLFLLNPKHMSTYGGPFSTVIKTIDTMFGMSHLYSHSTLTIILKGLGVTLTGLIGILVWLIYLIIYLVASIKVYISVMKALMGIILDLIIAPLVMAASAIPGQDSIRKQWINRVMKNALTFPVTLAILNAPRYLVTIMGGSLKLDVKTLATGDWSLGISDTRFATSMGVLVFPLICYFAAANVSTMLADFFPTKPSEGFQKTQQAVQQNLSKTPILGNFFGAK
ncbi:hypothetical protein GF357_02370 [Candidatus Dojkabacteria bacterium]|nr:hypothetical protein [Candidatus Dojkabacteria bacterium]